MPAIRPSLLALAFGAALAPPLRAQVRDTSRAQTVDTLTVTGRYDNLIGIAATASEGRVGAVDLRLRPILREGELLETVPGLIAHGQGYTDLNFLIPETVEYLDYRLGVYHAEVGDFGSAGGAEFHLARTFARPFATVGAGAHGLARLAAGGSRPVGAGDLLAAAEVKGYDGPWNTPEKLRKVSGLARYSWERGASQFSILGMGYRNRWNSSDQIPLRAVERGLIDRFGQVDNSDGGNTQHYSLAGTWRHAGASSVQDVELFGIYSDL
jgi:hypothetical protein